MYRLFPPVIVAVFISLSISAYAEATPAHQLLSRAEECSHTLYRLSRIEKEQPNLWTQCIKKFQDVLDKADKNTAPRVAYGLGEVYLSRFQLRNSTEDLHSARMAYHHVLSLSQKGKWVSRAKIRLKTIKKFFPSQELPDTVVTSLRHWSYSDHTRIVIDLDHPLPFWNKEKLAEGQNRLVFKLPETKMSTKVPETIRIEDGITSEVRMHQNGEGTSVSIFLDKKTTTEKIFSLTDPDRLVIDLFRERASPLPQTTSRNQVNLPAVKSSITAMPRIDIQTIVIDPGHGGKDPGAIGRKGLTEKEVVLDIGLRLQELISKRLKKKVVMTRKKDVFVPLEKRTLIANEKQADLFISIHTNASPKRSSRGIEVYFLGHATDAAAMATAIRENSASTDKIPNIEKLILNDLERDFNINASLEFAHTIHHSITEKVLHRYPTIDLGVKRAPFFVLAHSRMPAILAELSFVSNPKEEKRLRSSTYRQRLAEALFAGVARYIASLKESY